MRQMTVLLFAAAILVASCSSGTTDTTSPAVEPTTAAQPDTTTTTIETTTIASSGAQITLSLEGLTGFGGLAIEAFVLPLVATEAVIVPGAQYSLTLGGAEFSPETDAPFSASAVIREASDIFDNHPDNEVAMFAPGEYRFIIEASVSAGPMRYGCERQIIVSASGSNELIVTSIPEYTGEGIHWTPYNELKYPPCPMWPDQT